VPLRIVADTNVLISAVLWEATRDARILDAARDGHCDLFTSPPLMDELVRKLGHPKFIPRFRARGVDLQTAVAEVASTAALIRPTELSGIPIRDPDDLHVLAAAVAAEANIIVSKDRDLLVLGEFRGIPILNVDQAADTLGIPRGH
jgi:putative PIN family toxin of toxin-antitoxin system